MFVRTLKKDKRTYDSIVLAYRNDGWKSKVIIFDEALETLIVEPLWKTNFSIERNIFIVDNDLSDYHQIDKNTKSYWNISNIFSLVKKYEYTQEMFDEAKKLQEGIEIKDWNSIKNDLDIQQMMEVSFGFHDAYIERIIAKDDNLDILFNTTWGSYFHLKLELVQFSNLNELDTYYDTDMVIKDDGIHMAFDDGFKRVVAQSIFWRIYIQDVYLINDADFNISEDKISFSDVEKNIYEIDIAEIFLDSHSIFSQDNTIGIINKSELGISGTYTFIQEKTIMQLKFSSSKKESSKEFMNRFLKLHYTLKEKGFNFITHDDIDYHTNTEEYRTHHYGIKHFERIYDKNFVFKFKLFRMLIVFILYVIIFAVVISQVEQEMRLTAGIILGSFETLLLVLMIWFFYYDSRGTTKLEIFDEAIFVTGALPGIFIIKSDIKQIIFKKNKILVYLKDNKIKKVYVSNLFKDELTEVMNEYYKI